MKLWSLRSLLLVSCFGACGFGPTTSQYLPDGRLPFPANYREWIFLTSGLDMSYSDKADASGHSMFDNVFVNPEAYQEFVRTGRWPEHTELVMETRGAAQKGSVNQHGKFQTDDMMGVEVHLKDTQRFPGGWAFFGFDSDDGAAATAAPVPTTENCYACHQQHAAVDTTFVQFYPTLLRIATQKGTLAPGYRP